MLCQFAASFGSSGTGIDIFPPLLAEAQARAGELGVTHLVELVEGDAGEPTTCGRFGVVSCIGATWIGGDLAGTLELMKRHLEPAGWLLVGEVYRARPPSPELEARYGQPFADLAGRSTSSREPGSTSWRWSSPTTTTGTATPPASLRLTTSPPSGPEGS